MSLKKIVVLILLGHLLSFSGISQNLDSGQIDVLSYHVRLEPNFAKQYIEGSVRITFKKSPDLGIVEFDSGKLKVTNIEGTHVGDFTKDGSKTLISLIHNETNLYEIKLFYQGNPKKGLVFFDNARKLHTVYFTSEWMVCNPSPEDKATLKLDLLIPKDLISVASGTLKDTTAVDDKLLYSWQQDYETPAYTYGFTIGSFNQWEQKHQDIRLKYYAENYNREEIQQIFQYTGNMMTFFEEKTGIPFPQDVYTQVLIGQHYQEMSGFAILKQSYGRLVLKDSTETNLISHELAHQWWGNRITCKSWNHFWLNEGFATFMSAAFNEYQFGPQKYQADINAYYQVYQKIKAKGKDKPLVFTQWINPSSDDRNLVYFKGAYVLHVLREELGDPTFWKGIKHYTQTFYGKAVTTKDFQSAMEASSGRSLEAFFQKWVY